MSKSSIPSVWRLLRESVTYVRKQMVLLWVTAVFFFLPLAIGAVGTLFLSRNERFGTLLIENSTARWVIGILMGIAAILLLLLVTWGDAAVLMVGKRQIQNRAGRSRSSLRAVRSDARAFVLPLFTSKLLRGGLLLFLGTVFAFPALWLMTGSSCIENAQSQCIQLLPPLSPVLIPMILLGLRTSFYSCALMTEDAKHLRSLRRSHDVLRGHAASMFGTLPLLWATTWIPSLLIITFAIRLPLFPSMTLLLLATAILAISRLLQLLSLTNLYGTLRQNVVLPAGLREAKPATAPAKSITLQEITPPAIESIDSSS